VSVSVSVSESEMKKVHTLSHKLKPKIQSIPNILRLNDVLQLVESTLQMRFYHEVVFCKTHGLHDDIV
jgi:hypothetical protein